MKGFFVQMHLRQLSEDGDKSYDECVVNVPLLRFTRNCFHTSHSGLSSEY